MTVQTGYGPQGPMNPEAQKLVMGFIRESGVYRIEPVVTNGMNYPEHSILLTLVLEPSVGAAQVVADPRVSDRANQTLLAVRPEDAQRLARQLLQILKSDQEEC